LLSLQDVEQTGLTIKPTKCAFQTTFTNNGTCAAKVAHVAVFRAIEGDVFQQSTINYQPTITRFTTRNVIVSAASVKQIL